MELKDFIVNVLGGVTRTLHVALDGISPEHLVQRPAEQSNTIGWLVWHLTRIQDRLISDLAGQEQAWVAEGWHARFGRPADPMDTGMGHTPEQVLELHPRSPQLLLDHYDAVFKRTAAYLQTVAPADLDRVLNPENPQFTVGFRLQIVLSDNLQHAGQAAFLRGLLEGRRMFPS